MNEIIYVATVKILNFTTADRQTNNKRVLADQQGHWANISLLTTAEDDVALLVTNVLDGAGSLHGLADTHGDKLTCRQLYMLLSAENASGA